MKLMSSFLYGSLALLLMPALAQQPTTQMGKIHGRVINTTGQPQPSGTMGLSTDAGMSSAYTFPVDAKGNYAGEAPAGMYTLIYRMPDTPPSTFIDSINMVVIIAGKDLEQNDDMSRAEFINELPEEQKKELEELKKQNAAAQNLGRLSATINADLNVASQDLKDADAARSTAQRELGKTAEPAELDAKTAAIKTAKYSEIESLMLRDLQSLKETGIAADETTLWMNLGRAELGLKKYDEAGNAYKRVLEIQATVAAPKATVQALAHAGRGEAFARSGNTSEATKAFDRAAQLDASRAGTFFRNEAFVFLQTGDADAQLAAAEKAIKAEPRDALPYYFKGNAILKKAGIDAGAPRISVPPACAEAYQKYLSLAPTGAYAPEVKSVLRQNQKHTSAAK